MSSMSEKLSPAVTLTREQKEQRRLAAAQDLLEGEMTQVEIAEEHGVTPSAVSKWKSTLDEEGIEGLKSTNDEGNQGPDSELDDQDREQLVELLEEGAQAHGWETDLWTSKRVAALIEREFDTDFTPRHCSRILRELGYRPVKPREGAAEKDPEEKRRWLNQEAEQLKKN
jgi:transposase